MGKNSKALVDRASATIKKVTNTDALKVSVARGIAQAMQQSPDWALATDVQAAAKVWIKNADGIEANAKVITDLRAQVKAAEAKQEGLRRDWLASKQQVISSVTVYCGGSADKVTGFNLDVVTRGPIGALDAPAGLAVNPGKVTGEVVSKWEKGVAGHGFLVQHATDPTNPATVSPPIASTRASFTLGGMPSSANVSLRVAAIDPASSTGQSPWSAWVVGNAR